MRKPHSANTTPPPTALVATAPIAAWLACMLLGLLVALGPRWAVAADSDGKALYAAKNCPYCHGEDGRTSKRDTFPIIAGQMPKYSYLVMQAYKSGERQGVGANLMWEVTDVLTDDEMKRLADYIATLK